MSDSTKKKADILSDLFNSVGNEKELAEAFAREHKTLQANFVRFVREYMKVCSQDTYNYDARNESVHTIATLEAEKMEEVPIPYV